MRSFSLVSMANESIARIADAILSPPKVLFRARGPKHVAFRSLFVHAVPMGTSASRDIRWFETIGSTNREAAEWARAGAVPGSVIVSDEQTAGRGRLDRSWFSPSKQGLFFSVILEPGGSSESLGVVGLAAAVALHEVLRTKGIHASVKWPNDVLIGGRKVAGILSESVSLADGRSPVVVGIGLNVGMSSFPGNLAQVATSLLIETGELFDREELLQEILSESDRTMVGFPASVIDRYRPICSTIGREVRIQTASGSMDGVAADVDERGGLVLKDGTVVHAGDVIHLR
ncbi:MAG TPA: biotin--[acetyl-CoA-carboxylase] ligase [Actinomycetota bacterium]|nr:biotin--[acetyl-CoA-carboxylase] ligase [Actinomycetota bacterium]